MYRVLLLGMACFSLLLATPLSAFGHTALEQSTPEEGTVSTLPTDITLVFNTDIGEQSTVQIVSSTGEPVPLNDLVVEANTLYATIDTDLPEGEYNVVWTIIGADGHGIEGSYTFYYEKASADSPSETVEDETSPEEDSSIPPPEQADPPSSLLFLLGGFSLIGIVSAIMLRKRRPV